MSEEAVPLQVEEVVHRTELPRPLNGYLLVKLWVPETVTSSGIALAGDVDPEFPDGRIKKGTVAVQVVEARDSYTVTYAAGDEVMFPAGAYQPMTIDGVAYGFVDQKHILGYRSAPYAAEGPGMEPQNPEKLPEDPGDDPTRIPASERRKGKSVGVKVRQGMVVTEGA